MFCCFCPSFKIKMLEHVIDACSFQQRSLPPFTPHPPIFWPLGSHAEKQLHIILGIAIRIDRRSLNSACSYMSSSAFAYLSSASLQSALYWWAWLLNCCTQISTVQCDFAKTHVSLLFLWIKWFNDSLLPIREITNAFTWSVDEDYNKSLRNRHLQ